MPAITTTVAMTPLDKILGDVLETRYSVDDLLSVPQTDWYLLFNDVGSLIKEYSQLDFTLTTEKRSVFFKFLQEVFASDAIKNLKENEKERLFELTQHELIRYSYNLNDIDDLKMLYDRFNVFLRVEHKNWNPAILDLIVIYANKVANSNIVLDKKIEDIDWHFTNFFWILNVNFTHYIHNAIDYEDFKKTFDALKSMNGEIRRWDSNSIFSFRTVLGTYRIVRQNLQNNSRVCEDLDQASKNFISNIIQLTIKQCFSLTVDEVKESAYIEYVKNLSKDSKKLFSNLYKTVDKKQVFPNEYIYSLPINRFKMTVLYQQLKASEKNTINKAILETYRRVENLRTMLKISYKKPVEDQFRLHIFNSKEEYVKYGPLWGINTAGGGYAQVRNPLELDQSMLNRPLLKNEKWYETFVYQQKGDSRNRLNKEGGNFRNLGHEVQHTLFYALIGPQGLHHLPSWMIEGAANALGNEKCFKEEADYIKNYQDRLPKIERIINMSYSSGRDMYYFGSALFRFMLERKINLLKVILNQAQEEKPSEEINLLIKNGLTNLETDFKEWLIQSIAICSDIEEVELQQTQVNSEQQQYQLDLAENPALKSFLQNTPTKFVFHDTIFHLTSDHITRSSRAYPARKVFMEKPQSMQLEDYNWFKSALEIYVIDTKLAEFNLISDPNNIVQSLVRAQGHEFSIRKIMKITNEVDVNLTSDQISLLNPALEAFVFQSVDLSPNLKKRFDGLNKQQMNNSWETILKKLMLSDSVCTDYLKSQKDSSTEMLSDEPVYAIKMQVSPMLDKTLKKTYQKQLKKSKVLRGLIKENGAVHFTFKDTIFVLTNDNLNRYGLNGNPQLISLGDFEWFESALEIFFIKIFFRKNGLDLNEEAIAKLLNVNNEYVSNRQIKSIVPLENACLRLMVQDFVLNSDLSNVLKNRLMQFGYEIHSQHENQAVDNMNAASVLGALTLMVSNASLILNSLIPTSHQLTQHEDDSCDENDMANNFYWFLTGGVLVTAAIILVGGFFWGCKINKAKDNHLVKEQVKTSSSDGELEKLKVIKKALVNLERKIKAKISRDAYVAIFKEDLMILRNNIEDLLNIVKKGFNPGAIFIKGDNNYQQYSELFIKTLECFNSLKAHLARFKKSSLSLNKLAGDIAASLRELRPLPTVPDNKDVIVTIEERNQRQNNKILRYTPQPLSRFKPLSWIFKQGSDNVSPSLATELQVMVDKNSQQNGGQEPIYTNLNNLGRFCR